MTEKTSKGNCFIIMPISTPEPDQYNEDQQHFKHVLECLLVPAVKKAGFNPVSPVSKGSDIIQAEIIKNLAEADLVLCDMSVLNANVFYELGIRTALDKPIALVADDRLKKIPFDMAILNCKTYKADLKSWELEEDVRVIADHISDAFEKAAGGNSMWKYFGVAQVGEFKPGSADITDKVEFLTQEIMALRKEERSVLPKIPSPVPYLSENIKKTKRDGSYAVNLGGHKFYGGGVPVPISTESDYEEIFRAMLAKDRDGLVKAFHVFAGDIPEPDSEQVLHCAMQAVSLYPSKMTVLDSVGFAQWVADHYW